MKTLTDTHDHLRDRHEKMARDKEEEGRKRCEGMHKGVVSSVITI